MDEDLHWRVEMVDLRINYSALIPQSTNHIQQEAAHVAGYDELCCELQEPVDVLAPTIREHLSCCSVSSRESGSHQLILAELLVACCGYSSQARCGSL